MPCSPHLFESCMKNGFSSGKDNAVMNKIRANMVSVKELVRVFKVSSLQAKLDPGFSLLQSVKTRFVTMHTVAERFEKAGAHVLGIVNRRDNKPAHKFLLEFFKIFDDGTDAYVESAASQAVADTFNSIIIAQIMLRGR